MQKVETAPSDNTKWDEFSEQHQHQSIKKAPYLALYKHNFNKNKVQI